MGFIVRYESIEPVENTRKSTRCKGKSTASFSSTNKLPPLRPKPVTAAPKDPKPVTAAPTDPKPVTAAPMDPKPVTAAPKDIFLPPNKSKSPSKPIPPAAHSPPSVKTRVARIVQGSPMQLGYRQMYKRGVQSSQPPQGMYQ